MCRRLLRVLSGREVCRILQQHGFVEVRRRGRHIVMQRRTDAGVTVPIPDRRELAIGTLLSIIRQGGVPRVEHSGLSGEPACGHRALAIRSS